MRFAHQQIVLLVWAVAAVLANEQGGLRGNDNGNDKPDKYDCDEGCPGNGAQVCGTDGQTHYKCDAFCQDIEVEKPGVCPPGHGGDLPLPAQEAQARRDQLREYLQQRRDKLDIKATTVTKSGQVIDWIDPKTQDNWDENASPPPIFDDEENRKLGEGEGGVDIAFELAEQPEAMGPKGTVPVLRRDTLADELSDEELPETIGDFLSKYGDEGDHSSLLEARRLASAHIYAYTWQHDDNFGGEGAINIWNPYVYKANEFSLGQFAVTSGSGSSRQTIEAGWQDYRDLYGDYSPHLFIFYTTNGHTSSGNSKGGYNLDVDGFVQRSSSIFPGAGLSPVSSYLGTQYIIRLRVQLYQGNWWIRYGNEWLGYYPASLFSTTGLRNKGSYMHWYGEVIDADDSVTTYTDMGSGRHANQGWQKAAFMNNLKLYHNDCGCWRHYDADVVSVTDSGCYSIDENMNSGGSWGSYFYWGGPGRSSTCN